MRFKLLSLLTVVLLVGCATQRMPFPEDKYASLGLDGDKTVKGRIFLIDHLEEKQIGSGVDVSLEPFTAYCNQWYDVVYINGGKLDEPDPGYYKYVKRTKADENGNFTFENVAAGEYLLNATMKWEAVTCSIKKVKTPVMICKKIAIADDDKIVNVELTKDYKSPTVVCDLYNQGDWEDEYGL
ncbi:MAG: hypothetical protein RQ753_09300 [Desulfurivibrionaceae bacterium]|nr:hypothetical protein [Desulfurivibrionaceae bacterium]